MATNNVINAPVPFANSLLANMADQTIKGNVSGGPAAPSDLTASQVNTMLGTATNAGINSISFLLMGG